MTRVEIEIIVDGHEHAGVPAPKGSIVKASPHVARRLVNMRCGRLVEAEQVEEDHPLEN